MRHAADALVAPSVVSRRGYEVRARAYEYVNERTALVMGIVLACLAGVGDALTTAEVAFTLVYFLPIAIVTWYRGRRSGRAIVLLCIALSGVTDFAVGPRTVSLPVLIWNLLAEAVIFLVYSDSLARLRARVDQEMSLRLSAMEELRHAERLNTLGKLASGVAHELGTPLNVISGRAELIRGGRLNRESMEACASIIVEQAQRMTHIIRNMLDFARRSGTRTRPEDLRALCQDTAELLRSLAQKSAVEVFVTGKNPIVPVNRAELQQVVSNLISNAIQAMPHGGRVTLSLDSVRTMIPENNDRADREYARLTVRDEGPGIPPEILPRIFDPFFTTKDVGEGTGLGLSVSYGIVRDHGGVIRVQSLAGEGTRFRVYLPQ